MTPDALTTLGATGDRSYSIQSILVFLVILGFGYGMLRWRNRHADEDRPTGGRRPDRAGGPATGQPAGRRGQERPATDPNRWEAAMRPPASADAREGDERTGGRPGKVGRPGDGGADEGPG